MYTTAGWYHTENLPSCNAARMFASSFHAKVCTIEPEVETYVCTHVHTYVQHTHDLDCKHVHIRTYIRMCTYTEIQ